MANKVFNSVGMEGFKCFENLTLKLGQLTVLSGYNGAGKSTAFQPILLFSQALRKFEKSGINLIWPLNGDLVGLGSCGDVVRDRFLKFEFTLSGQNRPAIFEFDSKAGDRNLFLSNSPGKISRDLIQNIAQTQYISVMRGDVVETYPVTDESDFSFIGVDTDGKYAVHWLNVFEENKIDVDKFAPNTISDKFGDQVNAWLDFVIPGTSVIVKKLTDVPKLTLQFRLTEFGDPHNPVNVGFGISYVFPIIVALLCTNKGNCVIIDSPEAHLHPSAQSKVGIMIAKFAASGIQIILETHSDHVLNGIRIAVMEEVIKPSDLSVLFFSGRSPNNFQVTPTAIDNAGQFEHWPEGFFDQKEKDLITLIEGK